jgi:hypothetical protein
VKTGDYAEKQIIWNKENKKEYLRVWREQKRRKESTGSEKPSSLTKANRKSKESNRSRYQS